MLEFIRNVKKYFSIKTSLLISKLILTILPQNVILKQRENNNGYHLLNIQNVHYLYPNDKKQFYKIMNRRLKEEFKEEGWNAYSVAWHITLAQPETFEYEINRINYRQLNQNVQDKLLTAKDLSLIEDTLRKQFVNTFIRIE